MRVLHLSDLHLTGTNKTFADVWHGPAGALGGRKFDAIVVSGDLSQRAGSTEYKRLLDFANDELVKRLERKDKSRIIFVPGNHDINWGAPIGRRVEARELRSTFGGKLGSFVRKELGNPLDSQYRHEIDDSGKVAIYRIDEAKYVKRKAGVQKFLHDFYGTGTLAVKTKKATSTSAPKNNRLFNLLSRSLQDQFSATLFPEHNVAFYGFDSTDRNDAYWTGARINPAAVAAARAHAEKYADGMLRVAVWHHGFWTQQGRPDYLGLTDIGVLYNNGFRVGMHGHTHRAAVETHPFFHDRFVVVATGSLGAGSEERPDAVGNQFSVVHLLPSQVRVDVFERDGGSGVYAKAKKRTFALRGGDASTAAEPSSVDEHRRKWAIDSRTGIASVKIELTNLELRQPLAIALVTPPRGSIAHDDEAETNTEDLTISRTTVSGDCERFMLSGTPGAYEYCVWKYRIANAFALSRRDLQCMADRAQIPKLNEHEEARSHTVRFPCSRLQLSFVFEDDEDLLVTNSGRVIVEERTTDHGEHRWVNVPSEEKRCKAAIRVTGKTVVFDIDSPVVGYRYTPVFKLARDGVSPSPSATRAATDVLKRCREEVESHHRRTRRLAEYRTNDILKSPASVEEVTSKFLTVLAEQDRFHLARYLTDAIELPVVSDLFGLSDYHLDGWLGRGGSCIAMIWDEKRGMLFPAFGRFPPASWAARFSWGVSVAGQAFRFGGPATWTRDDKSDASLIFQTKTQSGPFLHEYEWVVAVPIAVPGAAPVGIVSFASAEHATDAATKFHDAALEMRTKDRAKAERFLNDLQSLVTAHFWRAVSEFYELQSTHREAARRIVERLIAHSSPPSSG